MKFLDYISVIFVFWLVFTYSLYFSFCPFLTNIFSNHGCFLALCFIIFAVTIETLSTVPVSPVQAAPDG
jgi:hypothetical protein